MDTMEASLTLLDELNSKDRRACIELLIRIFGNVEKNPEESKYRTLKVTNKTFREAVWRHEVGRAVMEVSGWVVSEDTVQLPPHQRLTLSLEVLLAHRDVKPDEREWVEETKVVVPNAAKVREEQLRKKALEEKEKQMAALQKEMKERKQIAARIRAEHQQDMEQKRVLKASKAAAPGKGEVKKMSDMLPKNKGG